MRKGTHKVTCTICGEHWTDKTCVITPQVDGYFHVKEKHPEVLAQHATVA